MKIVLFGASGMVGQGVLRECLLDRDVSEVLSIARRPSDRRHEKLREVMHADFSNFSALQAQLTDVNACFFCLGVSSAGMSEAEYRRVTHDFTLRAAEVLARQSPKLTFVFVSGAGTDSSEQGSSMWARVKGQTENALLRLPLGAVYLFRPALIQPLHGITSRTGVYRFFYALLGPLVPAFGAVFPKLFTTTERIGQAMLQAAKRGAPKPILDSADINALAALATASAAASAAAAAAVAAPPHA